MSSCEKQNRGMSASQRNIFCHGPWPGWERDSLFNREFFVVSKPSRNLYELLSSTSRLSFIYVDYIDNRPIILDVIIYLYR